MRTPALSPIETMCGHFDNGLRHSFHSSPTFAVDDLRNVTYRAYHRDCGFGIRSRQPTTRRAHTPDLLPFFFGILGVLTESHQSEVYPNMQSHSQLFLSFGTTAHGRSAVPSKSRFQCANVFMPSTKNESPWTGLSSPYLLRSLYASKSTMHLYSSLSKSKSLLISCCQKSDPCRVVRRAQRFRFRDAEHPDRLDYTVFSLQATPL